ncbi:MAG TPA: histidine kinase dimerization/phospho-acceptor domain-containing protein [Gemmatimonadaceae bacterium]
MLESYSANSGVVSHAGDLGSASAPEHAIARDLIARLIPDGNAEQIVLALEAERASKTGYEPSLPMPAAAGDAAARELQRVRRQYAYGASARNLQHAFNNPLTALLAEAQLLGFEPLAEEPRAAVDRILELTRRLVTLSRLLAGDGTVIG